MSGLKTYKVRRPGRPYYSMKAARKKGQEYYPTEKQARLKRRASAKVAARMRKRRGTQWRHGRKSKVRIAKD